MQVVAGLWATFSGRNGIGAITLTRAKVGDIVSLVYRFNTSGNLNASFEQTISVNGQIQQIDSQDLSGLSFGGFLLRSITTT